MLTEGQSIVENVNVGRGSATGGVSHDRRDGGENNGGESKLHRG
jgi:hypothetical protein